VKSPGFNSSVSNAGMQRALTIILLLVFGVLGYWCYERLPWIDIAAYSHSQRAGVHCGHIVEPDWNRAQAAIDCAISAREHGRPFVVIFSVHGIDEQISSAVVGDSKGNAVEIVYATGMVTYRNTLMRHHCKAPVQLQLDPPTIYHVPRLHCAPWSPTEFKRDYFLW